MAEEWHYEYQGQARGPVGLSQMQALIAQGDVRGDTLVWTEGQVDWLPAVETPLNRLFPPGASGVPPMAVLGPTPSGQKAAGDSEGIRNLNLLTGMATVLLLFLCAVETVAWVGIVMTLALGNSSGIAIFALLSMASWGLLLLTVISVLAWFYRAENNVHEFGATNLQFTAGSSVWWWFVPFANLVQPYRLMREIWNASVEVAGTAFGWRASLVGWWWAGFWASIVLGRIAGAISAEFASNGLASALVASLVGSVLRFAAAGALIVLMRRVLALQVEASTHERVLSVS